MCVCPTPVSVWAGCSDAQPGRVPPASRCHCFSPRYRNGAEHHGVLTHQYAYSRVKLWCIGTLERIRAPRTRPAVCCCREPSPTERDQIRYESDGAVQYVQVSCQGVPPHKCSLGVWPVAVPRVRDAEAYAPLGQQVGRVIGQKPGSRTWRARVGRSERTLTVKNKKITRKLAALPAHASQPSSHS